MIWVWPQDPIPKSDQGPAGAFFLPRMCDATPMGLPDSERPVLSPLPMKVRRERAWRVIWTQDPATWRATGPVMSFQLQEPTRPFLVQPGLMGGLLVTPESRRAVPAPGGQRPSAGTTCPPPTVLVCNDVGVPESAQPKSKSLCCTLCRTVACLTLSTRGLWPCPALGQCPQSSVLPSSGPAQTGGLI